MTAYAENLVRAPKTMTEREVALLLKVTGEHRDGFRDHVIFAVALGSALREHEIVALNVGDVFEAEGHARRRVRLRVFKRSSGDDSGQEIILNDTLRAKLAKLYRLKRHLGDNLAADAPIFVSRKGNRLSERQVRNAFAVWQVRASLDRHFHFHVLRHTACTNHYRRHQNIRLTQKFARHRSIISTAIYTHPSDEELLRSVQDLPC
jgi:integrase/recombinase XerC